jgi:hypothetical protein
MVRAFWQDEFDAYPERFRQEAISPIQNKVGALLSPPAIRNIIGQPHSTIDLRHVMDEGKVLIVNLSKGRLGDGPSHLLGALIASAFAQAAEGRAGMAEADRRDFTLYVDEFQNFATDSFATILSEARKWRLSLVVCHQFSAQVPRLLHEAVIGNAGTMIAFRTGASDAPLIAAELGLDNPRALTDLSNFQAYAKLIQRGVPSNARWIATQPAPLSGRGRLVAIRARTRARHARSRVIVEERIRHLVKRENA